MSVPVANTFLAGLTEDERVPLLEAGVKRRFPRQAVLIYQDEPDDRVMLLLDGRVKVARVDHEGRESLLSIRDPGDLVGELAFIDGQPRLATVSALEPVEALVIPSQVFRSYLETVPRVAVVLLEIVSARFRESTVKRSQFGASDTMGRLAARLLELVDRYGEPGEDGIAVSSPLSQEDLAAWTGASRAGVAEALRGLRELGWVRTGRSQLVVSDVDALRARAAQTR